MEFFMQTLGKMLFTIYNYRSQSHVLFIGHCNCQLQLMFAIHTIVKLLLNHILQISNMECWDSETASTSPKPQEATESWRMNYYEEAFDCPVLHLKVDVWTIITCLRHLIVLCCIWDLFLCLLELFAAVSGYQGGVHPVDGGCSTHCGQGHSTGKFIDNIVVPWQILPC